MWWESFRDSDYYGPAVAVVAFVLSLIVGAAASYAMRVVAKRVAARTPGGVGGTLILSVRRPVLVFIALLGAFIGTQFVSQIDPYAAEAQRAFRVAAILVVAFAASAVGRQLIDWYTVMVAPRTATSLDEQVMPIMRRILSVIVYGIALLLILDTFGQSVSVLLGGLGITGLAVALALQPTLSNFFAGTYVMSDHAIKPGDYIELQGGPAGYVIEVGWRTTKIRTWWNTLVIIPNALMADTMITNYQGPDPPLNVLVSGGVSYDSELEEVERVVLEEARAVIAENEDAVKTMDPWFGFDSFGDSNISFWVFLQAKDRIGSFVVTNEVVKRIHARFKAEGIEINYPVRKVVFGPANGPFPPIGGNGEELRQA